jgi:nuclear-control-of-ATPase protein 2
MNSSFTTHYIQSLATSPALPDTSQAHPTSKKWNLQSLVVSLKQPLSRSETRDTLHSLERIERDEAEVSPADQADREEYALRRAVLGKIVIGLYAEALDTYLTEASEAEAEAEWWADVERSRRNVAYYFVQSENLSILLTYMSVLWH